MSAPTPDPAGLSESERRVLDDLAAHENAGDPGFVLRMNRTPTPDETATDGSVPDEDRADPAGGGLRRDRVVPALVLGAIVAVVLPLAWTIAMVLTLTLVIVPTILVVRALRDGGGLGPPSPRPDAPAPPDRS